VLVPHAQYEAPRALAKVDRELQLQVLGRGAQLDDHPGVIGAASAVWTELTSARFCDTNIGAHVTCSRRTTLIDPRDTSLTIIVVLF
jgi:hypothetical protein